MNLPRFISLDGIDGVGKSTQIAMLAERLTQAGCDVMTVRDPGSTEIGARLREILLDSDLRMNRLTEAMLFMASRTEMIETILRPALAAGKTIISDRFLLANVVYQSTGNGRENGKPTVAPETLWQMGRIACGGLSPDLTLVLDMPVEIAMARLDGPADRMESRGQEYMANVREAFLRELPQTGGRGEVIDAQGAPDEVAERIWTAVTAQKVSGLFSGS
ncbi:dTMP kinase [Neorhodopirellula pilleata]|uniref:Thymidylate kinase n=1 Tax=Neorhodopirellula pilleata TaxID=2714738 RepID=A0A5C6AVP2_9BACT|nr:dTMP kinase [Neorhodopirellula pilleata]TWU03126.1 Thymidylate kinase [Neorhodopirellula pilleata]